MRTVLWDTVVLFRSIPSTFSFCFSFRRNFAECYSIGLYRITAAAFSQHGRGIRIKSITMNKPFNLDSFCLGIQGWDPCGWPNCGVSRFRGFVQRRPRSRRYRREDLCGHLQSSEYSSFESSFRPVRQWLSAEHFGVRSIDRIRRVVPRLPPRHSYLELFPVKLRTCTTLNCVFYGIVYFAENKDEYFAEALKETTAEQGTDEVSLSRQIVSRAESDLGNIKAYYETTFGSPLALDVEVFSRRLNNLAL